MSRFMLQLMVEWPHNIEKITLQAGQEPQDICLVPVTKDNHVMSVLHGFGSISPSALSTYLRCQLRFFYAYVVGLSAPDDNDAEAFSAIHFGNIFHRAAELVYEQLLPRERLRTIPCRLWSVRQLPRSFSTLEKGRPHTRNSMVCNFSTRR